VAIQRVKSLSALFRRSLLSASVLALVFSATPAHATAQWSDNVFAVWAGPDFREPFDPDNIWKTIVTYKHVDGDQWGGNFLNVDWLFSNSGQGDDVATTGFTGSGPVAYDVGAGALEVYAVYRRSLMLDKMTKSKTFAIGGVVRDMGFVLGADVGTKNHAFSERKIMPTAGIRFEFNVPGFWNIDLLLNKEWGVNGQVGLNTSYNVTEDISTAWGIPVVGPLSFEGFMTVNFPKGSGGVPRFLGGPPAYTVTEVLFHPKLMLDIGKIFDDAGWQIGVGYELWLNKFGNDHNEDPTGGSYAHTFFGEAAVHF